MVHILLKPGLENFEHYFASVWDECNCAVVWTFFGIAFLWDWIENWPFPVPWPLLSFPNLLAYWEQHHLLGFEIASWTSVTSTSFVCSNVSQGPLDFTVQDVWSQVTDHTIMIIWVVKTFLYSSVYSCHLFLISFASVRSLPFLSFIVPIFVWNVILVSLIFFKRSHLSHSLAFLYFFALFT